MFSKKSVKMRLLILKSYWRLHKKIFEISKNLIKGQEILFSLKRKFLDYIVY
ncbi:MAG: hypothetical protein AAB653_03800 [Patescibacteria group bacterium]